MSPPYQEQRGPRLEAFVTSVYCGMKVGEEETTSGVPCSKGAGASSLPTPTSTEDCREMAK